VGGTGGEVLDQPARNRGGEQRFTAGDDADRLEQALAGGVLEQDMRIVPAETVHAVRNVGEANGAELATYVIEKGKPFIVLAED
jgi:hypothetical protein